MKYSQFNKNLELIKIIYKLIFFPISIIEIKIKIPNFINETYYKLIIVEYKLYN